MKLGIGDFAAGYSASPTRFSLIVSNLEAGNWALEGGNHHWKTLARVSHRNENDFVFGSGLSLLCFSRVVH